MENLLAVLKVRVLLNWISFYISIKQDFEFSMILRVSTSGKAGFTLFKRYLCYAIERIDVLLSLFHVQSPKISNVM